jgi:GT2 family glycosyltransferase
MDLSVIIVCYKGWEKLTRCLESLASFSGDSFAMEVIVFDNDSADIYLETIEKQFTRFRFIRNRINGGYSNGCNIGVANSTGENILILNPDTVVNEDAIERLLKATKEKLNYFIISCRQIKADGTESKATGKFPGLSGKSARAGSEGKNAVTGLGPVTFPDWVSGSLMMMRREIFEKLNGFDEDFWMYSEDVDLCKRARNSGGEIAFFRDITIEHNHGGSSRINLRTTSITKCEVQISRHLFIQKHMTGWERILMHGFLITDNIVTGLIACLAGLIFFFIPNLLVRVHLFRNMITYYIGALARGTWISKRSVNFKKIK